MYRYYEDVTNYYIYCLISADFEVKIGYTWNLKLRKQALERQINKGLSVHSVAKISGTRFQINKLESSIHSDLNAILRRQKKSEWYPYVPSLIDHFMSKSGAVLCFS